MTISADQLTKRIIDYLFLPTRTDHRTFLSRPLLLLVVLLALAYAVLSLPVTQHLVWQYGYTQLDRALIIPSKDIAKAWFESLSFVLDLSVAILIGGSIFGERLAKSFEESIKKYEEARDVLLGNKAASIGDDLEVSINMSIEKIQRMRSEKSITMLKHLPDLIKEMKNIYNLAFKQVPNFYKRYLRFVFYSSFPGGLYGLSAFLLFFTSCGFKLVGMYLGSPYLVE